jgi:hypothetical protein
MRLISTTAVAVVAVAVASLPAGAATPASSAATATASAVTRQFEGTVVSKNPANRTFRLRDSERGVVRIRVTRNTRFERIAGFRGLKAGMKGVESTVRRRNGRWVALTVERSGGGGRHGGGNDDRGGDDD